MFSTFFRFSNVLCFLLVPKISPVNRYMLLIRCLELGPRQRSIVLANSTDKFITLIEHSVVKLLKRQVSSNML